ncbi:MAG: carboxypeptidase-like regulatory domain-containing protein [Vicinamibacterales bacterium]
MAAQGGGGGRAGGAGRGQGGPGGGAGGGRGGFGQGPAGGPGGPGGGRGGPARDSAAVTAVGTGTISGMVVLDGGSPARRARVTLNAPELRGGRSAVTDDAGRFTFPALPAGRFTMTASKPGFVDNSYGAKKPGRPGTPIQLADGQKLERAVITLPRGSVLTGIVVDERGEPSAGTPVRALRFVSQTGERTLQSAGQDQTDDRGMYRIYQLQPGDYIVTASPRNVSGGDFAQAIATQVSALVQQAQSNPQTSGLLAGLAGGGGQNAIADRVAQLQQQLAQGAPEQAVAYAPVYYPGTATASAATTVTLGVAEERAGVDFQLQLVPTSKVEGTVTSFDGTLPQGTQVSLISADKATPAGIVGTSVTRVDQTGHFRFAGITPGDYTLQARATVRDATAANDAQVQGRGGRGGPGGPGGGAILQVLWASVAVSVAGQDLADLGLSLQPGMSVQGRVEFHGTQPPADLTRVRVSLTPRGSQGFQIGGIAPVQADASGHFSVMGVAPGRYVLNASVAGAGAAASQQAAVGRGAGAPAAGGRGGGAGAGGGLANGQWRLKSAVVDGRDVLDFPLEIGPGQEVASALLTFTDKSQQLSGTIQDTAGRPTADFAIIVFPSDKRYWLPQSRRILSTRPDTDGKFTFGSLPEGDYRLTAVTDVEPGEWYDPAFLTQLLQASIPVSIVEGDKKVQNIRLAGG